MTSDLHMHMPCGCPFPKIGDHRPCEHGNNAYDDDLRMTDQQIPEAAAIDAHAAAEDVIVHWAKIPYPCQLAERILDAVAPVIAAAVRERLAGLARRILAGDARAFTELATILDDALECGS